LNVHIQIRPLPGSSLADRYLSGDSEILPFFSGDPYRLESYRRRWAELGERQTRKQREIAAAALHPTSQRARERLARFVDEGGAVVTTGQQAGLFTGPLYTVYKALTAVRLADRLEQALGVVVLPVFWTASEDHDWAEVDHTHIIDRHNRLRRVSVPTTDARPLPMSERTFGSEIETAVDDLAHLISGQEHGRIILQLVRDAYQPGRSVAMAFRRLIAEILAPFDVLITDAADPALKEASLPVLRHEVFSSARHEEILRGTADCIAMLDEPVQVPILASASNVFLRTAHGRERLLRSPRGWLARDSGARFAMNELEHILSTEPGRFSPNVLLRPVVESTVFPVLAYVAGPGEISYFAQLRGLFEAHGTSMPLVYPRTSVVLLEPAVQECFEQTGLTIADLGMPRHVLLRRHSRGSMPEPIGSALAELRADVVAGFDHLAKLSAEIDPALRNVLGARRNRVLSTVREAETKILRSLSRNHQPWQQHLDALFTHLKPLGSEQERVVNVLPYLATHGMALLDTVVHAIPINLEERG
jgi:bacillithiol synthase